MRQLSVFVYGRQNPGTSMPNSLLINEHRYDGSLIHGDRCYFVCGRIYPFSFWIVAWGGLRISLHCLESYDVLLGSASTAVVVSPLSLPAKKKLRYLSNSWRCLGLRNFVRSRAMPQCYCVPSGKFAFISYEALSSCSCAGRDGDLRFCLFIASIAVWWGSPDCFCFSSGGLKVDCVFKIMRIVTQPEIQQHLPN